MYDCNTKCFTKYYKKLQMRYTANNNFKILVKRNKRNMNCILPVYEQSSLPTCI